MRYFFISLFSILVSGCDPHVYEPIISNTNQNGPWLHGKKLDLDSVEDIACLVQYKMFNEQDLIFEVGFTNLCNKTVLVDPTLFSGQALSIFPNIKHPESYTMLKPAVDPEWILKDLDANIEKTKAEVRSTEINNSIFMFLDILLAIGSNETDSEKATTRAENQRFYANNQTHLEASQNQIENTLEAKIKMETLLLRKTTLFPGKTIAGLVHFHRHDESSKFEIHLPVEARKFSF